MADDRANPYETAEQREERRAYYALERKWQSLAYELVGMAEATNTSLDFALALVCGRDAKSVRVLFDEVMPSHNAERKRKWLTELTSGDTLAGGILNEVQDLTLVRNALAHGSIVEATATTAAFEGRNRGKTTRREVTLAELAGLKRFHVRTQNGLWSLAVRHADPEVVAEVHGFLEP